MSRVKKKVNPDQRRSSSLGGSEMPSQTSHRERTAVGAILTLIPSAARLHANGQRYRPKNHLMRHKHSASSHKLLTHVSRRRGIARLTTLPIAAAILLTISANSLAQMRAGQRPVLEPQPRTRAARKTQDISAKFQLQYKRAGRPKVLLFWNAKFSDSIDAVRKTIESRSTNTSNHSNTLDKQSTGTTRTSTLHEKDTNNQKTDRTVRTSVLVDTDKQPNILNDLVGAQLETEFKARLLDADVRLIDRAPAMRLTQALHDRATTNIKLLEADAALKDANVLLEILLLRDPTTPLGAVFKLSAFRLPDGALIASKVTTATPTAAVPPGHYEATENGFEWSQPEAHHATVSEIADTLADDVMYLLAQKMSMLRVKSTSD